MQQMQPAMDAGAGEHHRAQQELSEQAVRKGPWTIEEDNVLVSYVAIQGEGAWNNLARAAGLSRTGKSCRLRWLNYLRPDVRRGSFTTEEQELIVRLHARWGNKWSRIAKNLPPGRTDNEVKNFWRTKIQKKKRSRDSNKERGAVGSIIAGGGACRVDGKSTPAIITEGQGSSNSGQTTGVVSGDYGILEQRPSVSSMDCHQGSDAGEDASGGGAINCCFFPPEFLAASGENFWAIGEFWSMVQSFQGNS